MALAISNRYYDRVIFATRSTMLLVGLVIVMMLVIRGALLSPCILRK